VYEGVLDSRPVAVKRLLRQFYNLARKEINVLVVSDEHPNVVRCFAMEEDREFVYLALERCRTSLAEAMKDEEGARRMTVMGGEGAARRVGRVAGQVPGRLYGAAPARLLLREHVMCCSRLLPAARRPLSCSLRTLRLARPRRGA
jgi:hypothetical protein